MERRFKVLWYLFFIPEMSPKRCPSCGICKYKTYSKSLENGLHRVKNGGMSLKRAAELYHINRSSLINHLKDCKCGLVGRSTILSQEQELHVLHILTKLEEWRFGMNRFQLKTLIQDYLKRIDLPNPFKDDVPGKDYWMWKKMERRRTWTAKKTVEHF